MMRIAGVVLAGGMILGAASSAPAQMVVAGNGWGMNPYGFGVPGTTFYNSGYRGFGPAPVVGSFPAYGVRPMGFGYRTVGYRPFYGSRNFGMYRRGGFNRGWGFGGRRW